MEWQWPTLLLRCMDLPPGLFELIVDMLPLPRMWQWWVDQHAYIHACPILVQPFDPDQPYI